MNSTHEILHELEAYAKAAGLEVSTVCRYATGNARLRDRLRNRLERVESDVALLRAYMKSHPVDASSSEAS